MGFKYYASVVMIVLALWANLLSFCPEGSRQALDVHFSLVPCTAHECTRSQTSHSCEQECHHKFCNDRSVLESSNRTENVHLDDFIAQVPMFSIMYGTPANPGQTFQNNLQLLIPPSVILTPLRI